MKYAANVSNKLGLLDILCIARETEDIPQESSKDTLDYSVSYTESHNLSWTFALSEKA